VTPDERFCSGTGPADEEPSHRGLLRDLRAFVGALRPPLRTVEIYGDLVEGVLARLPRGDADRARLEEGLSELRRAVGQVSDLADALIGYVEVADMRPEPVDLGELVDLTVVDAQVDPVIVESGAGAPPVWGDREHLTAAILELVRAARQATPPAEPVRVRVLRAAGAAIVEATCAGRGPSESRFDLFAHATTAAEPSFGLALARRIAALHGGTLAHGSDGALRLELPAT
jgi:signal transduction histidine kinase